MLFDHKNGRESIEKGSVHSGPKKRVMNRLAITAKEIPNSAIADTSEK